MNGGFSLSIIIPHYNIPDLLERLLSTIPDKKEIQVIVVDDGSSRDVREQLNEIQEKYADRNFLFLENDSSEHNAGLVRNIGLKYAEGEWLLFADADDYFLDEFYESVAEYFDTDYDIVFFQPISVDSVTGETTFRGLPYARRVQSYLDEPCVDTECELRYTWFPPWAKMIRRSVVVDHKIAFESVKYSNDMMFSVETGYYARKITASPKIIYCVTRRTNSLITNENVEAFDTRVHEKIKAFTFLKKHLTKKELHGSRVYRFALIDLSTVISRKYGARCFFRYFKLFRENGMIILDVRIFSLVRFVRRIRMRFF